MAHRRVFALAGLVLALAAPASAALAAPRSVMFNEAHNASCKHGSAGNAYCSPPCNANAHRSGHDGAFHTSCATADHGPTTTRGHYRGISRFEATVSSFDGTLLTVQSDLGITVSLKVSSRTRVGGVDGAPNTLAPGEDVLVSYYAATPGVVTVLSVEILPRQDTTPTQGTETPTPDNGGGTEPGQPTAEPTHVSTVYTSFEATVVSFDGTTLVVQSAGGTLSITMVTPTSHVSLGHRLDAPATLAAGESVEVYQRNGVTVGVAIIGAGGSATAQPTTPPAPTAAPTSSGTPTSFSATVVSFDGTTLVVQGADNTISITMSPSVSVDGSLSGLVPGAHVTIYARVYADGTHAVVGVVIQH